MKHKTELESFIRREFGLYTRDGTNEREIATTIFHAALLEFDRFKGEGHTKSERTEVGNFVNNIMNE